ncbi:MAG: trypsin-like peptidase domain-containing protein [Gorillibacterium sp.]|nr:trypsin-like peptidase domain-containing protein [Gorillibacterium sp.]
MNNHLLRVRKTTLSVICLLLVLTFAIAPAAKAEASFLPEGSISSSSISKVVSEVTPSVVAIIGKPVFGDSESTSNRYNLAHGTGIIVSSDGVIMTNAHVVKNMKNLIAVTSAGKSYSAKVTHYDEESDLALIKIEADNLPAAVFAAAADIHVGDNVIAIGTPISFALRNSITAGIVSGMDRSVNTRYQLIQTDAAINPGNSGGPLVNLSGEIIGINTLKYTDIGVDSLGFAIPADTATYVLKQFLEYGKVKRPFLGVELEESWEAVVGLPAHQPLSISYVSPDSPAATAGLKEGDFLLAIDGKNIDTLVGLNELLKHYLPGQSIKLTIKSGNVTETRELILGEEESTQWITTEDGSYLDSDEGKTQIGDSLNGWSMKYPTGLVTYNDFSGEDSIMFGDAKEEFLITVSVEKQQSEDLTSSSLLRKLSASGQFGTVLERKYIDDPTYPYAKITGKLQDGSYYQARAFLRKDTIYYITLYIENSDIASNKSKLGSYLELLGSFKPEFNRSDLSLKDIASSQKTKTVTSDYGFSMEVPSTWSQVSWAGGIEYGSDDNSKSVSATVTSAASRDTLEAWALRQEKLFASTFATEFRKISGLKKIKIAETAAMENIFSYTMGDKWWVDHDIYFIKDKYKFHFIISYAKETEPAEIKELIRGITESIRTDKELLNPSLGFIQDEEDLIDPNRTTTYINKKYKYSLKVPELWESDLTGQKNDIKVASFSFLGGSLQIEAKSGAKLADVIKTEENEHKKSKNADADYKYTSSEKLLFGVKGREFQVSSKNKNIPYKLTEYVFAKKGFTYIVKLRINDAVRTTDNLKLLEKTFQSLKLME